MGNKMLRTASFMAVATLLAKICGLVRDMCIAGFYGTGIGGTAYITATRLPTTLFDIVIGGVISATFIPVFTSVMERDSKEEAMKFASRFITMILSITILITIFGIVFSDQLITFMAPEFNQETHNLAAQLSSIMFPMIIFTGLAFSFVGILQSFGEFNIPSIISLVSNLAIILYFVLFGKRFGVHGLAVTMVIAWSLQAIIQVPYLKKFQFRYRPSFQFGDKNIRHALALAGPMLVSTWVQPLYSIVNSRLASGMQGGRAVSMLDYANRLYIIIVGVFSFVVTNLIFPKLARANASNQGAEVKTLISTSLKAIVIIILPIMAGFMILSQPITSIIYERGQFLREDTMMTAVALSCYSTGMIGLAFNEILSKAFFSMQNSKTPMLTAVISMVFNIILAYTLAPVFGIGGLAVATAGGSTANALLNYLFIRRYHKNIFTKTDLISIGKTVLSALVMAGVVWLSYKTIGRYVPDEGLVNNIIIGGGCAVIGAVVYFICCYAFGVDEIKTIVNGFMKKNKEE